MSTHRTLNFSKRDAMKFVSIEIEGNRLSIVSQSPDGSSSRKERHCKDEQQAIRGAEKLIQELKDRGFEVEARSESPVLVETLPPRVAPVPNLPASGTGRPERRKKSKRKKAGDREGLLVKIGLGATGAGMLGLIAFVAWILFGPVTLVGSWRSSRGPMLARIKMEGGNIPRVLTFESDGTAYAVYPDFGLWMRGSYEANESKLRLRFDRQGYFEKGEESSPGVTEETYTYSIKHGMLDLVDETGQRTPYMQQIEKSLAAARADIARMPKGPPPAPAPATSVDADEEATADEDDEGLPPSADGDASGEAYGGESDSNQEY
jgi:hypothetical protein